MPHWTSALYCGVIEGKGEGAWGLNLGSLAHADSSHSCASVQMDASAPTLDSSVVGRQIFTADVSCKESCSWADKHRILGLEGSLW